jgi:hypothetical protein
MAGLFFLARSVTSSLLHYQAIALIGVSTLAGTCGFLFVTAVTQVGQFSEAYEIAKEHGINLREQASRHRFPSRYLARLIMIGETTAGEAHWIMRSSSARFRCDSLRSTRYGGSGPRAAYAEKYLFLSDNETLGQMVLLFYDESDTVNRIYVPDELEYRLQGEHCVAF